MDSARIGQPENSVLRVESSEDVNLWDLAATLARKRRLAVLVIAAFLLPGVPLIMFGGAKREYESVASFVPPSGSSRPMSLLAGFAAQYGMPLPGGQTAESPQFYADLLLTRRLLSAVAASKVEVDVDGRPVSMTLVDFFGEEEKRPALAREAALKRLTAGVQVHVNDETGVVTFAVAAPQPRLARQIAALMLEEVHNYNRVTRQSSAAAERRFVEARLAAERSELLRAERALQQFLQQNRQYQNSPGLRLRYDRLQQDLTTRQGVVQSLVQAFEEAKIAEVRNTPVISVLESPEDPVRPKSRGRLRKLLVLMLVATAAAFAVAVAVGTYERANLSESESYRRFRAALGGPKT